MSFSDLLEFNDFLDHPDTLQQIFDFYTFKNHTFESVWVSAYWHYYYTSYKADWVRSSSTAWASWLHRWILVNYIQAMEHTYENSKGTHHNIRKMVANMFTLSAKLL